MAIAPAETVEHRKRTYGHAPACTMVLFGAGGDLTKRLVMPALYNLVRSDMLDEGFKIIGVDIADLSDESWIASLTGMLQDYASKTPDHTLDKNAWSWLTTRMRYMRGDFSSPQTFADIKALVADNVLFYLAVADRFFGPLVDQLGAAGLTHPSAENTWRRVIIEKPFGHDLASARALNTQVLKSLDEDQIYRMDHFLGKETVQNITMLRFGNGIFEPLWTRDEIDNVQITVAETVGVERRGKFYEVTGALRDMVPNHVFQLLAVTAMEPPVSFDAEAVRTEKAKVLQAVHIMKPDDVLRDCVRGQYADYRKEPDVSPTSDTETYVALKLQVDNWRWGGVPFYLRTGKHLARRQTEIAIQFRRPPFTLFRDTPMEQLNPNKLILHLQPDEGISLYFNAKNPGPAVQASPVRMDFRYQDFFSASPGTGYEILLYDCMIGDATLFQRADFVDAGWSIVQPILDVWRDNKPDFPNYTSSGEGPVEAEELLQRDGRTWRTLS
jgi:glucose-6-phosphate 1-dehydrogenase